LTQIATHFRKPQVWLGAALAAVLPVGAVMWKTLRTVPAAPSARTESPAVVPAAATHAPAAAEPSSFQAWFEGSANPFLTTAQTRERRMKEALAKVEAALLRRGDVQDVLILADDAGDRSSRNPQKPRAVVSIRMRRGLLPVPLADAAGSLVAAALGGAAAEDVEVMDELTGTRVRAQSLDADASNLARIDLQSDSDCLAQESRLADAPPAAGAAGAKNGGRPGDPPLPDPAQILAGGQPWAPNWIFLWPTTALAVATGIGALAWWIYRHERPRRGTSALASATAPAAPATAPSIWSGPLSCALHQSVAEKPALIAASLVERLESAPSSRQEVATLLLELEPWAARRILSVLPDRSLDLLEASLRQSGAAASPQHVRALAEAMISLRAAA
jgi:hypothetical protein